tara:strand:- start:53765 stop:55420 length:1656 start_codon:yes stop_codon:yes gene_type:complete
MNNIVKSIFLCGILSVSLYSCTDLEEVLVDGIGSSAADGGGDGGSSESVVTLTSAYDALRTGTANHGGYFSIQSVSTDEMAVTQKGGDWYDGGLWLRFQRHQYGKTEGPFNDTWKAQYTGIGICNELLAGTLTPAATAQVKTLRAFFYSRLVDLFGNVKIITVKGQDEPQSTRAEVFAFIESELLAAIGVPSITEPLSLDASNLPATSSSYEVNQFGALGLLAKLYLNAEVYTGTPKYDEARIVADYIISNSPYILADDSNYTVDNTGKRDEFSASSDIITDGLDQDAETLSGYAALFAPNNGNNPEMIWSINYDETTGTGMNFAQMTLHYGSQLTWSFADQPWNGYTALSDFYNMYDDSDDRKKYNFVQGPQYDAEGYKLLDYASDVFDENTGERLLQVDYRPYVAELEPNSPRFAGVRLGKFSFKMGQRAEMDNDYPIVRLGEIYLIRAEAEARAAGDWSLALSDVNTLRARANAEALTSIDEASFLDERGKEMFQEATRRQDLIRFDLYNNGTWWEKETLGSDDLKLFPIPLDQVTASDGSLTQNPGY